MASYINDFINRKSKFITNNKAITLIKTIVNISQTILLKIIETITFDQQ